MTSRLLAIALLTAVVASGAAGCGESRQRAASRMPSEATVSASGVVDGWDVVLSVSAELPPGLATTARIDAVNSTDATISTRPLIRGVEIRDSGGAIVPANDWQLRVGLVVTDKPAGAEFVRYPAFTVPPPGVYTMTLPGLVDSKDDSLTVRFTSRR